MHIALLSPSWPPGSLPNGIVTYVSCMRQELTRRGHRVSVFSSQVDPAHTDPDTHALRFSIKERISRSLGHRLLRRTPSVFSFGKVIASGISRVHAREPIDVIEMEESFGWAADVAEETAIPVVCKLHGPAFLTYDDEELNTRFAQERVRQEGVALRRLPVLVSPSRWALAQVRDRYRLEPVIGEQVLNPLPSQSELPIWDLSTCDRNTILFVGRFELIKGADVLIRAFQRLLADRPELKLVFVGPDNGLVQPDGSTIHLKEFVASLADPALELALSYRGRLDPSEIVKLRPTAMVTVVASRRENQPFAALEAMLQACPLICSDTAGLGEMIAHGVTGLKARPEDADDLAAMIRRMLDDPPMAQALGRAGREYVLKQHAPATVVEQMLGIYRRAIALPRPGHP